jgi:hypothetical protein
MDGFERDAEVVGARLAAFEREVGTEVRVPGTDVVRRTVLRRQRARTRAVGALASVALVGMFGVAVADRRDHGSADGPVATASADTTTSPSAPVDGSLRPGSVDGPGSDPPSPADLHLSAVKNLTLTFNRTTGRYEGTLSLTVRNTGPTPYEQSYLYLAQPAGVGVIVRDFAPCVGSGTPEPTVCDGPAVPARGGQVTYPVWVSANYGHQKKPLTLTGLTLRMAARIPGGDHEYPDPTPADNKVAVTLVLAP